MCREFAQIISSLISVQRSNHFQQSTCSSPSPELNPDQLRALNLFQDSRLPLFSRRKFTATAFPHEQRTSFAVGIP